jgi:hypothetical protein
MKAVMRERWMTSGDGAQAGVSTSGTRNAEADVLELLIAWGLMVAALCDGAAR